MGESRHRRASALLVAVASAALSALATGPAAAAHRTHRHRVRSHCTGARTPIARATRPALRSAVVCLVNRERTERGLPRLRTNHDLNHSAQHWTNEMVRRRIFTHGHDFAARITRAGFHWSRAGENIAAGFPTPASVVAAWMASTGHCENIFNPAYRSIGTGVSGGAALIHAHGTWTQDFALRVGRRPASHDHRPAAGCPYR